MLRPADILISAALDGCTAAFDVGITASGASETDADPAETMHNKKARERLPIQATLAAQNIRYVPIVWTSYGRPHEAAKAALQRIARQVARRRGDGCAQAVQRQMRRAIGTELARRVARMSLACWPTTSPQVGVSDSDSDVDWVAPVLLRFLTEPPAIPTTARQQLSKTVWPSGLDAGWGHLARTSSSLGAPLTSMRRAGLLFRLARACCARQWGEPVCTQYGFSWIAVPEFVWEDRCCRRGGRGSSRGFRVRARGCALVRARCAGARVCACAGAGAGACARARARASVRVRVRSCVRARVSWSRAWSCACARACACAWPFASACGPAVGTIHLGWVARYICLRSGCGSVGNAYNVFRGLREFWGPSRAQRPTRRICTSRPWTPRLLFFTPGHATVVIEAGLVALRVECKEPWGSPCSAPLPAWWTRPLGRSMSAGSSWHQAVQAAISGSVSATAASISSHSSPGKQLISPLIINPPFPSLL